jgi:hypothetical protein
MNLDLFCIDKARVIYKKNTVFNLQLIFEVCMHPKAESFYEQSLCDIICICSVQMLCNIV